MDPVWTLFFRRTLSRLAYWLSALGYDLRDRSLVNRIYLLYFCAFWMIWAIAVTALLGGGLASVLAEMQTYAQPPRLVVRLSGYAYVIWMAFTLWQVARRSPFVFGEEDAYLVCQTPVNRRLVGLLWFVQGTLGALLLVAIGAVVLSFSLVEWRFQAETPLFRIIESLKASSRALIMILPLHVGLGSALWGVGAARLHHKREPIWPRALSIAVAVLFMIGLLIPGLHSGLTAPLRLPLVGAFLMRVSTPERLAGLGLSLAYLAAGIAFLSLQLNGVLLSRAAQETTHVAALGQARRYGMYDLVDSIVLRRRLGSTRPPSRLLAHSGRHALLRKSLLQSLRSFRLRDIAILIWLFGLSFGMFRPSNFGLGIVMAGVWTISVGSFTTRHLRGDLAHWWLYRSLPLHPRDALKDDLMLSYGVAVALGWFGLALSGLPGSFILSAGSLVPLLVANAALPAAEDILRNTQASVLMSPGVSEENVPRRGIGGALQGLVSVLIPFGMLAGASAYVWGPLWGLAALPVAVAITWLNWKAGLGTFRWFG